MDVVKSYVHLTVDLLQLMTMIFAVMAKGIEMWIVTCEMVRGVLEYYVEHKETGERKGTFDCEKWAQEFANELNKGMTE